MDLSCGGKCLKFLVFFFNAIVFIGGGITGGYGIFLLVNASKAAGSVNVFWDVLFAAIVAILLVAEIICGIILLVYRHDFVKLVGTEMQKAIKELSEEGPNASNPTLKSIYKLQEECCGGTGPSDWGNKYPDSCCESDARSCTNPYQQGCALAMYEKIKDSSLAFGLIIVIVCLVQIGAVICASCLAKKVNEYEKV
ncbi:23 kDa integral membrane protein [Taenia crassiceps]|uniref:23 kDa integral membrane protein n=1 Tax=Taenia crassiceps TaxID=6207 RepID=A0ABR4QLF0_9CEST